MCEINPKHKALFILEVFTTANMTREQFDVEVVERLLEVEQHLNASGRFRFHIHETNETTEVVEEETTG